LLLDCLCAPVWGGGQRGECIFQTAIMIWLSELKIER
jgi:hypothetical protein